MSSTQDADRPLVRSWEEAEAGRPGQLTLPGFTLSPTVAERAFLALARRWHDETGHVGRDCPLPRSADILALSCLLIATEYGHDFTNVARGQIRNNIEAVGGRGYRTWMDELSWLLCEASYLAVPPPDSIAVAKLIANLDHHSSTIRCWMMELGWVARAWHIPIAPEAIRPLLKNTADTLAYPHVAAGLAAALAATEAEFWAVARAYEPPAGFEEQYRRRLDCLKEHGIQDAQAPLWHLESQCRAEAMRAVLGERLVKNGTIPVTESA